MYLPESEKNDSSAVTRLRRSDFIAAVYAFVFVFANFGIAIAARMPMITTTISSSISVKPFFGNRFMGIPCWRMVQQHGRRLSSWEGTRPGQCSESASGHALDEISQPLAGQMVSGTKKGIHGLCAP